MEIVVFIKFSSGNVIMYYITVKTMMFQLENEPTRGKRGGDKRIMERNTAQNPIGTLRELTAIRRLECLSNDLD